jgi:hypothetical protein
MSHFHFQFCWFLSPLGFKFPSSPAVCVQDIELMLESHKCAQCSLLGCHYDITKLHSLFVPYSFLRCKESWHLYHTKGMHPMLCPYWKWSSLISFEMCCSFNWNPFLQVKQLIQLTRIYFHCVYKCWHRK